MDNDEYKNKSKEELLNELKSLQTELSKTQKKNQLLEEGYIKLASENKKLKNDKTQIEIFLKTIFPKETHESAIHSESGLYEFEELRKVWMVSDTKKDNEFQKIINQYKSDIGDLTDKLKVKTISMDEINTELINHKKNLNETQNQLSFYVNNTKVIMKKMEELENEKNYIVNLIDEKNTEIEKLKNFELEIAEVKAKYLLMDDLNDEEDENYFKMNKQESDKYRKNNTFTSGKWNDKGKSSIIIS